LDEQAAAYLFSCGKSFEEIGQALRLTRHGVEGALDRAEEKGWLVRKPLFRRNQFTDEQITEIMNRCDPQPPLLSSLNSPVLQELRAVSGKTAEEFGRAAAIHVAGYIEKADSVGVAWGQDLFSVVAGLERVWREGGRADGRGVRFFPLRGDPLAISPGLVRRGSALSDCAPSALCWRLHNCLCPGDFEDSLSGIPAMIPPPVPGESKTLSETEIIAVMEGVFRRVPAYRRVAGGPSPLLAVADAIITSVGPVHATSEVTRGFLSGGGGAQTWPHVDLLVGDIAGVPLPVAGHDEDPLVASIERRWLGLKTAHLKQCVARADGKKHAGVIVCARLPEKAAAVAAACRLNLVSRLVVGDKLAQRLSAMLVGS
jgi:DNA-binding transcriptional regulator LsrR (DeoR family)